MKMNATGAEWLRKNDACTEGYAWAIAECANLREVWDTARPDWLVWVATREGVLGDRTLWEFACWCAEQALPSWVAVCPDDERPQQAIEARRGWLRGEVSDDELSAARSAALSARSAAWSALSAAWSAARSAESEESAALSAAWSAARSAARSAESEESAALSAWSAALSAWSAALSAESAARSARSAAAKWLRDNATPTFPDGA